MVNQKRTKRSKTRKQRKPFKQLNDVAKGQIIGFHKAGWSTREIAIEVHCDQSTISRLINKFKRTGDVARKEGSGRPRALDDRMIRRILNEIRKNPFITAAQIKISLGIENVSDREIQRIINESGNMHSYWSALKPYLSDLQKHQRLLWAQEHLDWSDEQWENVIFSDESPFTLRSNAGRRVWRLHNQRYNGMVTVQLKSHESHLNVWGAISAWGCSALIRVQDEMDALQYRRILKKSLVPYVNEVFPDGDFILQQDNDPKHTSILIENFLEEKGYSILDWPPYSPDLNPIENIWGLIETRLLDRRPANLEELFETLLNEWNILDIAYLTTLSHSMRDRCQAVIDQKGGITHY